MQRDDSLQFWRGLLAAIAIAALLWLPLIVGWLVSDAQVAEWWK